MKKILELLRKALMIIAVLAIIFSSYQLFLIYKEKNQEKNINNDIVDIIGKNEDEEEDTLKFLTKESFSKLHDINNDFIGYLYYPSLDIYEAVTQTTDNAYYLDKSLYKEYLMYGTVFMSYDHNKEDQNRTLYGHWVLNSDAKFSNLHKLRDENNYKDNNTFYYADDEYVYEYEVAYVIYHDSIDGMDNVPYWQNNFSESQFNDFISNADKQQIYDTNVELNSGDKIMSLQTCITLDSDERLVVIGKEISKTPIEDK